MRAPLLRGLLCVAAVVITATACNGSTYSKRQLIAGIDDFCKCTGLQRKSDLLSLARDGGSATVMLSADGVSEKYWIEFVDGHPAIFNPVHYKPHWGQPFVKSSAQRKLCLGVIQRLDQCHYSWLHFGKPEIAMDTPRGFRVCYLSNPKPGLFSMSGNIFFLITPRGTVCSIWYGEHY